MCPIIVCVFVCLFERASKRETQKSNASCLQIICCCLQPKGPKQHLDLLHQFSWLWGFIYNRGVRTKQGLKHAYTTSHAKVGIYKNKLDRKICTFPRKLSDFLIDFINNIKTNSFSCARATKLFHMNLQYKKI